VSTARLEIGGVARYIPVADWLTHYHRGRLKPDIIAALTLWALVVPQSLAYAQIAGLPPQAGLFATFAGLLGYGVLGTSHQLVVSPTSSTAAISAALVAPLAAGNNSDYASLIAMLTMIVGATFILLAVLRLGFVSRFIAASVTTGFMFGLGLTIIVGQLPKIFGIPGADSDNFIPQVKNLVNHLGDSNEWTIVLGAGALLILFAAARFTPRLPAALAVVVAGIVLVALFNLDSHGVEIVGALDSTVPAPAIPSVAWSDFETLIPGALIIAVIGFSEGVTVAQSMADEHDYEVRVDQELVGVGGANLLSGLFQGFVVGRGASQSAANDRAGARTELVSLIVSALVFLTSIALLPLFEDLPQAALGAIVIAAVSGFLNFAAMRRLSHIRRDSFWLAIVAMVAVLVLGVLPGLIIAVAIAIATLLVDFARPEGSALGRLPGTQTYVALESNPQADAPPGLLVYRLEAPLLFLNARHLRDAVRERMRSARDPSVRSRLTSPSAPTSTWAAGTSWERCRVNCSGRRPLSFW
jgi:sulfate permease, SulP family